MRNDTRNDLDHTGRGTTKTGQLARLGDLDDYKVADGDPDLRGWEVKTPDGQKLGKVEELIADPSTMKVRYMEVKVDSKATTGRDAQFALVPIGTARLNEDKDDVIISRLPTGGFSSMPAYSRDRLDRDYESSLRGAYGTKDTKDTSGDFYGNDLYDEKNFFGKRRKGREDESYLTRSEEELAVGKKNVEAGSVDVRKRVETEHVKEQVPVTREEVTVERRPINAADAGKHSDGRAQISEDEIRVPLMAEQVVVEKKAVPKEEVVIKKHATRDEQTVEADLKKERIEVDKHGDVARRDAR